MTHTPERSFEQTVAHWFTQEYGPAAVETQHYQAKVRWYCDIVVTLPFGTLFCELESRASEIRHGIAQALGYAAADPVAGIPMVITPAGHLDPERVERLRTSSPVIIREFDEETQQFV